MIYRVTLIAAIVGVFAASLVARQRIEGARTCTARQASSGTHSSTTEQASGTQAADTGSTQGQCRRIVAMAPSITETFYALGLGGRLVGVTRDCKYPPEVEEIKKRGDVGSYYDINFEAIVALRPDRVVMLKEQSNWLPAFEKLGLQTLVVSHQTTDGIIESFGTIGTACGKGPEGRQMQRDFRHRVARIRAETAGLPRPRVLFVLDRSYGRGHLADLYVAADDDYIDTIIQWAGGQNAYRLRGVRYPVVSVEGILWLNPDVIVDMVPPDTLRQLGRQAILDDWNQLKGVKAVKDQRVLIPERDYAYVPGPRFLELVEYLAGEIHPEGREERGEGRGKE
jgi:iron complex transport system substrate-binding protein